MKEIKFLEHRIIRLWQIEKIKHTVSSQAHKKKVVCATKKLVDFATEQGLPASLILNQFAYYLVFISKESSFNKIYLKVGSFIDAYDKPEVEISDDDVEFAYEIESEWNDLHASTMADFPFSLKTVLMKSGIKIKSNTFFEHSNNFQDFCIIAQFVRCNRRVYPQIHSLKEFFLHLPILRKRPGRYMIWQFVDPAKDLDKYYRDLYGKTPKNQRFSKFKELFQEQDNVKEFKNVWGIREMS